MNDLLLQLDHEARQRAFALEMKGKLPPLFTEQHYPLTLNEQRELRRLKAAGHAAVDVDTYVALCKGLPVPASRLNQRIVGYQRRRNGDGG